MCGLGPRVGLIDGGNKLAQESMKDITRNYQILSDSYFTAFHQDGDLQVFCSSVFPDIGWNYAIVVDEGRLPSKGEVSLIRQHTAAEAPVFVVSAEQKTKIVAPNADPDIHFEEYSTWMSCKHLQGAIPAGIDIKVYAPRDSLPIPAAISVFEAAYCGDGAGSIGYSQLGPEYPAGFGKMLTSAERAHLIAIHVDDQMAAVASVVFHPEIPLAGLYNVGVHPKFRGRGLGSTISRAATMHALENGATRCILQTEAGSEVALMYEKMGYSEDIMTYFMEI